MSENHGISFIATVRVAGRKQSSLLVTVNKEVVKLLGLEPGELVQVWIKRATAPK